MHDRSTDGLITNIQRFSIHDGPGIRTTVFLKGCNLRCFWCHNPEDMNPRPEVQFFAERCIYCSACVEACPQAAHVVGAEGEHLFLRPRCDGCGLCVETCYAKALVLVGTRVGVAEVMQEILADAAFYGSTGGVTLSGGEPLLQLEFATALLDACRGAGIHTAIETAANLAWERLAAVLPRVDLVMMDIKQMDSARHRAATGVPNERILANAARLGEQPQPLIVRTPIIPGVNDSAADVAAIAQFAATLPNLLYYELLPYHPMAKSKYRSLDLDYRAADLTPPPAAQMAGLAAAAAVCGIPVRTG